MSRRKMEVADAGDLKKYRIELPNLIDDLDLSVYAFRLYVHLKRVAGSDGQCWQSTRTLAAHCKMSLAKVSESKRDLIEAGLITVERRDNNQTDLIVLRDIWQQNFARYATPAPDDPEERSPHEHPVRPANTLFATRTPRSSDEHPRSQGERKKEPIEERTNEKEPSEKGGGIAGAADAHDVGAVFGPPTPPAPPFDRTKLVAGRIPAGHGSNPIEVYLEVYSVDEVRAAKITFSGFLADQLNTQVSDLTRWREVVTAWRLCSHFPGNWQGMLDWYRDGIPAKSRSDDARRGKRGLSPTRSKNDVDQSANPGGDPNVVADIKRQLAELKAKTSAGT